jgi:signal peptidase II
MSEPEPTTSAGIAPDYNGFGESAGGLRPLIFLLTVFMVLAADQASKMWMVRSMSLYDSRPIFGQAFRLTLTHNTGGAWGTLPRGNGVFAVFAAVAIVALILAYQKVGRQDIQVGAAFALAMGGAIGNLLDRIRLGYVVDFFDARIIHWPIFNIADSAITISIILLVWHFLRPQQHGYRVASSTD